MIRLRHSSARAIFVLLYLLFSLHVLAQPRLLTWNIANLGASKSAAELSFIAEVLDDYDVVAIQEVVAGPAGPLAVKRLAAELNRNGLIWAYAVSAPTSGSAHATERYAFLWKKAVFSPAIFAWLDKTYASEIDREPYCATFIYKGKPFTLVSLHATTKEKKPEREIKLLASLRLVYPRHNLIFLGDFNLPQSHNVFNPLRKLGWESAVKKQKTTFRQKCINGDCLASEYDNIWYDKKRFGVSNARVLLIQEAFTTLKEVRNISDHLPVSVTLKLL